MKTIRVTGITLSIVALLLVAIAPPDAAACTGAACLNGTYAFRLGPAKSYSAYLANNATTPDPGNVKLAPRQNVGMVGVFTANGSTITGFRALATTDPQNGDTWTIEFTGTGTYTVNPDLTGTLTLTPAAEGTWICTDMTTSGVVTCTTTTYPANEGTQTYSISISPTNGRVELTETDNNGGGAKIFLTGEAIKY